MSIFSCGSAEKESVEEASDEAAESIWSSELMNDCVTELENEMRNDPMPEEMMDMFNVPSYNEIATCMCTNISELFPNLTDISDMDDMEDMFEDPSDMFELIGECMGEDFAKMMKLGMEMGELEY
tara:strand:+ start:223 stop:597 length:375 start_codon:yes stop_codon:yes gene_type:complete